MKNKRHKIIFTLQDGSTYEVIVSEVVVHLDVEEIEG